MGDLQFVSMTIIDPDDTKNSSQGGAVSLADKADVGYVSGDVPPRVLATSVSDAGSPPHCGLADSHPADRPKTCCVSPGMC